MSEFYCSGRGDQGSIFPYIESMSLITVVVTVVMAAEAAGMGCKHNDTQGPDSI